MKEWNDMEKWMEYIQQEYRKIEESLAPIRKANEVFKQRFRKLPRYKRIYYKTTCFILYRCFKIKWAIERWHLNRQSAFTNPKDLR